MVGHAFRVWFDADVGGDRGLDEKVRIDKNYREASSSVVASSFAPSSKLTTRERPSEMLFVRNGL